MSEYVTVWVDGLPDIFPGGEEIVRCRDCKHATELVDDEGLPIEGMEDWFSCHGKLVTSWDYYNDEPKNNPVEPDGFCPNCGARVVE